MLAGRGLGCAARRGRVRAPGDRGQAGAARARAARRAGPSRRGGGAARTRAGRRAGLRRGGRPRGSRGRAGGGTGARLPDRGLRAARRGLADRPALARPLHPAGARRDRLPHRLGALARLLRAPRPARRAHRAARPRRRGVELPVPVPQRERDGSRRRAGGRARLGRDEGRRDRGAARADRARRGNGHRGGGDRPARRLRSWRDAARARQRRFLDGRDGHRRRSRATAARRRAAARARSERGSRDRHRDRQRHRAAGGVHAPGHRLRRHGRRADRVLDERRLAERDRRSREARRRGLVTIALVGYDGGRVAEDGLADHLIVSRSQHIPRIQEAHATASHLLRELVEVAKGP